MSVNSSRDLLHLLVMLESIEKMLLYSDGFETAESFLWANDQVKFNASLMLLSNIGEYANKVSEETRIANPSLPWKQVRALRNRISHDYVGIDYEMVFSIIQNNIPSFKKSIEVILKQGIEKGFFDRNECKIAQSSVYYKHIEFNRFI